MADKKTNRRSGQYFFSDIADGLKILSDQLSGKASKEKAEAVKAQQEAREAKAEKKREVRGVDSWDYVQKQSDKKKIRQDYKNPTDGDYKKGGAVKMAKGGAVKKKSVSSASKRADGIAVKGKTKGRFV
jgi:hypothetical protein